MKPLFEEHQKYTQWWLWLIIISAAALVMGIFVHALYIQLILGESWGDKPMSDEALIGFSLFIISSMVLMLLVFFNAVLEVVVDKSSVNYRYFPILRRWRRIERENIRTYEIKTYYLRGYGIRWDLRGNKTINVKGHVGIEFTMLDGHRLLLGTQRPQEFLHALDKMKTRSDD